MQNATADEIGEARGWEDPHQAQQDQHSAEQRPISHQARQADAREAADDLRHLQADQYEDHAVEDEHNRAPHRVDLETNRGREDPAALTAQNQPARDHRQDS
jgi:hypothetical protein